jgi:hypothetical protein
MTPEQQEAFEAVKKINEELYEKWKLKDISLMPVLSITFANEMFFISLSIVSTEKLDIPELHLYGSPIDDRIFYEKSNKYETFYKLIKRKFIEIKEEIYSIKL